MLVELKERLLQLQLCYFPSLALSSETEEEELDLSALGFKWTLGMDDEKLKHLQFLLVLKVEPFQHPSL
ncbi:hypothetical protein Tco_0774423 [Tanacetum coccineum]|uniref:Uncharacterized protein n=1 Tax=Tanacetum coccineum TaxID=301880 RepID=A0ABQ4ZPG5_9ASTR